MTEKNEEKKAEDEESVSAKTISEIEKEELKRQFELLKKRITHTS
jgi:hypothetical protein